MTLTQYYWMYVVLLLCAVVLLTGCPQGQLPPLPSPFEPGDLTTEEVSRLIAARMEHFENFAGRGKVRIQTWEERYKFSEAFVFQTPASFRLETLGFLDQPAIFFTSDENMLSLYSKKHNAHYRGVASRENLFKLSGINLSVEDMLRVFSGNPPRLFQISSEWGFPVDNGQRYYLERVSMEKNVVQRLWFDTTLRTIAHLQEYMLSNGELILDVVFEDFRGEAGAYLLPRKISIDRPLDKTRVDIEYRSFEVNQPDIDQALFQFIPPARAKTYFIDAHSEQELERLEMFKDFQVQED